MLEKKYIDTNIFLNGILYDDRKAKEIVLKIADNEFIGVTSILTWDEIVFIVRRFLGKDISIKEGEKFLRLPNIFFIDVSKKVIDKAQLLISKYNIKPRDAIHAATAILNNVQEIISYDDDFDKVKELKRIKV